MMEDKGKINFYIPRANYDRGIIEVDKGFYTINLSVGTTPFYVLIDTMPYNSRLYQMPGQREITVTYAFYRPRVEEYKSLIREVQLHVLRGGLLKGLFGVVKPLDDDPTQPDWSWEELSEKTNKPFYGERI